MSYPATGLRIIWSDLSSPTKYEDMVSVLLSVLDQRVIRVDGSGGDGGKDVYFPAPEGLLVYELKSFTGRFTKNRENQVKRSFAKARTLEPKSWTLVCPIDLTNSERARFEKVTAGAEFECQWFGKTWLDARMAEHPEVARYFLADVHTELEDLARLFQHEQAALVNGIPDALERMEKLSRLCAELSPFYRIDIATDTATGSATATLTPKYPGAERDDPISVRASLAFPDQESAESTQAMLQAAYDFGEGAEVPSAYVTNVLVTAPAGLGGEYTQGQLSIAPAVLQGVPEFRLHMVVTEPDGGNAVMLPLSGRVKTAGAKGLVAHLSDSAQTMSVTLRINVAELQLNARYRVDVHPGLPEALLPSLRLIAAMKDDNLVVLNMPDGTPLGPPSVLEQSTGLDERYVRTVELLARVQNTAHCWFDLPDMDEDDIGALLFADRLQKREIVSGTWERYANTVSAEHAPGALSQITTLSGGAGSPISLWPCEEIFIVVGGNRIRLGMVTTQLHSARLANPERVEADLASGKTEIELEFVHGSSDVFERWLGRPDEKPQTY
jgi:hypothetical protein